jgi:Icc-related predicted phosphoesterase
VRDAVQRFQPLLSLHGHIHESRGATKIGGTLALNPGSSYEEGILQAAIVNLDPKKRKVRNYQLVNG